MAVSAVTEMASCWPTCFCDADGVESGSSALKGRVCSGWRMIPGILCLVANIVGIACALIWKVNELYAAFVPGSVCSGYFIYLGWDYNNLQTFSENNVKLEQSVNDLEDQNKQFSINLNSLGDENKALMQTKAELESQVSELQELKENMQQSLEKSQAAMDTICSGLRTVHQLTAHDHEKMDTKLLLLEGHTQKVGDSAQQLNGLQNKMQNHSDHLTAIGTVLKQSVETIGQILDQTHIKERMSHLQSLSLQEKELLKNLIALQGQVSELKGQHLVQVQHLEATNRELQSTRANLDSTAAELAGHVNDLGRIMTSPQKG